MPMQIKVIYQIPLSTFTNSDLDFEQSVPNIMTNFCFERMVYILSLKTLLQGKNSHNVRVTLVKVKVAVRKSRKRNLPNEHF